MSDTYFVAFQRFGMAMERIHDSKDNLEQRLLQLYIKQSEVSKEELQATGELLYADPISKMILYANRLYFIPQPPPPHKNKEQFFQNDRPLFRPQPPDMPILEDTKSFSSYSLWALSLLINTVLILLFSVVLRKLWRLKQLKQAIRFFGEDKKFNAVMIQSEDELGQIAKEFNVAMEKIDALKEARTLFLRNILHELKTPIMKGRLISHSLENVTKKEQLERIFERLESLLGEMTHVEKLSSNEWVMDVKEYRLVDVVDHAMDLLMSDTSKIHIQENPTAPLLNVDFELFATALKNILDNALKHSNQNVDVLISKKSICVYSVGEKMSEKKLNFSRPFNRETEGSTVGLGLGLYITNAITLKHGFRFLYEYKDKKNCFSIVFSD